MAANEKTPSERRPFLFHFQNLISEGAELVSAVCFASRRLSPLATTTLAANVLPEDGTIQLAAHPGIGAFLIVNPGGLTEEEFKVRAVSGSSPPYTATVEPTAEFPHTSGDAVQYEPGASARFLVSTSATILGVLAVDAEVSIWHGASGQVYHLTCLATCDNGEVLELEADVTVLEVAPTETGIKQPAETRDLLFNFPNLLDGVVLDSAVVFVSRVAAASTTLAALAAIGDPTVTLAAHPGIGALLTINDAGPNREVLKVSGVSGVGPYVATVDPTVEYAHSNGEAVSYEPGATTRLLVSSTPTILAGSAATVRARRGAADQIYRVTMLGHNVDDSVIVQHTGFLSTPDL